MLGDLIETSPRVGPTTVSTSKLLPSQTPTASSAGQKTLSMIRKTIKLPQGPSHMLSFEGCTYKRLPATPRRSALPTRRLGSGFEGFENILPPKEPRRVPRSHRTGSRIPTKAPSLDLTEARRETKPPGLPQPIQPFKERSNAFTSTTSSDNYFPGKERTQRIPFPSIEKGSTEVRRTDEVEYTVFTAFNKNNIDLPPVRQHSITATDLVRPVIALHRGLQSSSNNECLPPGWTENEPRRQASGIRRRVTFEDETRPQAPGTSSPPLPTSTIANTIIEIESDEEEAPGQSSSPLCKGHESSALFARRASSRSDIQNSDSLGPCARARSSQWTFEQDFQVNVFDSDGRLPEVADDIVDNHSSILSAENHRVVRRGSLTLSNAWPSSPPPSSDLQSPCRLRAGTSRGAIHRRSEIPETPRSYGQAAPNSIPESPLRLILKKGE